MSTFTLIFHVAYIFPLYIDPHLSKSMQNNKIRLEKGICLEFEIKIYVKKGFWMHLT